MMKNLLVVERNEYFRQIICASVKANIPGIKCYAVDNGLDAVKKANELKPHVIFIDISLPDVNGLKVIETVKRSYKFSCAVILTGAGQPEYIEAAKKSGADYFIPENSLKLGDIIGLINDLSNHEKASMQKWNQFQVF
jgi:DNA-binding NarL/FixJ family response regulator